METVGRVKVDRGKLDHKTVPRVIVEVTEHDNYRIACKNGVLKDFLVGKDFRLKKSREWKIMSYRKHWAIGNS